MKLKILGSSSKGNCYLLVSETEALIIEAGIDVGEVKKALGFQITKVAGCIVTHEHGDHARHVNKYIEAGFDVYMTKGTAEAISFKNNRKPLLLKSDTVIYIGNFTVLPFKTEHDANEPVGFLIKHKDFGTLLFLTDTYYSRYTFKGLNYLLIETNYCENIATERVCKGELLLTQWHRLRTSHLSIQTCKKLLSANDLSKVQSIVLIHLSDGNSNAKDFKKQVEELTGIPTTIADAGVEMEL